MRERSSPKTGSAPLRVVFAGAKGRMGRALLPGLAAAEDIAVVGEVDLGDDLAAALRAARADVAIDFTEPASAVTNARTILRAGAHGVIGTTGFTAQDLDALDVEARSARRGLLVAPNFAVGVLLMMRFAEEAARHFPRAEVVETHHEGKKDAPSGTARATAERIAAASTRPGPATAGGGGGEAARGLDVGGVRVHSLRLPGIMARQEVHFGTAGEALVLRHDALSRECYLPGVLAAVRAIPGKIGLLRGLEAILFATPP